MANLKAILNIQLYPNQHNSAVKLSHSAKRYEIVPTQKKGLGQFFAQAQYLSVLQYNEVDKHETNDVLAAPVRHIGVW